MAAPTLYYSTGVWAPVAEASARGRAPHGVRAVLVALLLLAVPAALGAAGHAAGAPTTASTLGNNGATPPPTVSASAAYDAADGYVVMFGGRDSHGSTLATTWLFTRGNWSELTPAGGVGPPARFQAQMAYDPMDQEVVLFGGCADPGCGHDLSDTWTYVHGAWSNITSRAGVAPPPRDRALMVYDAADALVLLFGGEIDNGQVFMNDTWTFQGGAWSEVSSLSSPSPSARAGAAAMFDPSRDAVILFGGHGPTLVASDTWSFVGGNWTDLTPTLAASPSPRYAASATFDSEDGYPLVVNGYDAGQYRQDTWALGSGSWTDLSDTGGPRGSYGGVLVDDPGDGYVLYFSGIVSGGAYLTSTLLYLHGGWVLLIDPPGFSAFDLLSFLFPLLLFPLIFGIMLPLGNFFRGRRERQLAQTVNLVPGEVIRWIETPHPWRRGGGGIAAVAIILVFPIAFLLPLAALGLTVTGIVILGGLIAVVYGAVIVASVVSVGRALPRAIGVIASGVIVRRSKSELRVGWENMQPSLVRPQKDRYWFQFLFPGRQTGQGGFVVTFEQARAILTNPNAPGWVLARPVSEALGLPPSTHTPPRVDGQRPPDPRFPAARYGIVPPPPAPGASAPVPVGPPASYPSYSPSPATVYYAPPPAPPPPSPPLPSAPARAPPGTTSCPRCGQSNPSGYVAFCRGCGQRLI